MSWNGMFCDRTHSSMCQTSIDSNLGVLLRAGTDEKVSDKLVNTIRARKVPNNVTDVSFSNIEVNPRGFRILTRRISTSDIHGWHGYRAWTSLGHPWPSPKNFRFRHCRRSNLDQNLPRITNPVSDLTGDQ
jgi:hypothetical protein